MIAMTLLVKNEIDILEANIRFHLDQFADQVIVTDNGSSDGSRELLEDLASDDRIVVFDEPGDNFDQAAWVTRMSHIARDRFGADWIVNNDADEFWVAPDGDLRASLDASVAPIQLCERRNLVASYDGPETGLWHKRLVYRAAHPYPPANLADPIRDPLAGPHFFHALAGKAALKAQGLERVHPGNHFADYDTDVAHETSPIVVYHYPVRARHQFELKIRQGGEALSRNLDLPIRTGWHWRRLFHLMREKGLDRALADALPSMAQIEAGLADGSVLKDETMVMLLDKYVEDTSQGLMG